LQIVVKGNSKGIEYSPEWASYINFEKYNEVKLKSFVNEAIIRLEEDFKEWV